jgi:hypothetical protein
MRWIGFIVMVVLGTVVGCVNGVAADGEQGSLALEDLALEDCQVDTSDAPRYALTPEAADLSLCSDRGSDAQIASCAARYACSRQLWRQDIAEDVYACLHEQSCRDGQAALDCLEQTAAMREPSEAEAQFERALVDSDARCGDLAEVAPGQADVVYESLTFCLLENDSCEAKSGCMVMTLEALVDDACGYLDEEPQPI